MYSKTRGIIYLYFSFMIVLSGVTSFGPYQYSHALVLDGGGGFSSVATATQGADYRGLDSPQPVVAGLNSDVHLPQSLQDVT